MEFTYRIEALGSSNFKLSTKQALLHHVNREFLRKDGRWKGKWEPDEKDDEMENSLAN